MTIKACSGDRFFTCQMEIGNEPVCIFSSQSIDDADISIRCDNDWVYIGPTSEVTEGNGMVITNYSLFNFKLPAQNAIWAVNRKGFEKTKIHIMATLW